MSVVMTVLVFVGIPLLALVVLGALTMGPAAVRGGSKYRPGRPWNHDPAWWLPEPGTLGTSGGARAALAAEQRSAYGEIAATAREQADRRGADRASAQDAADAAVAEQARAAVGGASGEW